MKLRPPLAFLALVFPLLAFASVADAEVRITLPDPFRPRLPQIPAKVFLLADFGAVGDGQTLNTAAFARALAAVKEAGGGRLVVPRGVYVTRPIQLCSNLDFHLEAGAVVKAPETFTALGLPEPESLHSQAEVAQRVTAPPPLLTGDHLHDVALTGEGTIDGSGAHWWAWSERAERAYPGRLVYPRPHLVAISHCERLLVADVTLMNSSKFHLVPSDIRDLTIERVKVHAPYNAPNTDAIDPGPVVDAWIHDCEIDTGDDDIVIKSGGTNVLIENCQIRHGHGISIGSGTVVGIHNLLVRHCTFSGSDNGIRIKSMKGAGGLVENVRYTDIRMDQVANPITLDSNYVDNNRPDFKGDPTKIPVMRDILIDHVTITGSVNAGKITGLPGEPIRDIILRDVQITAENGFVLADNTGVHFENVTVEIRKGLAQPRGDETKVVLPGK